MKYFLDTEFIEDGKTIDLISIGMVQESGKTLYLQNAECDFSNASDWVWRNVFPHLIHFDMRGRRSCCGRSEHYDSGLGLRQFTKCGDDACVWATRSEIKDAVLAFTNPAAHGKTEFWGYYADYDWVVFCQLFGKMIDLPKDFPMYCRDIKQWADALGGVQLPAKSGVEHDALVDAMWNREAYLHLTKVASEQTNQRK